VNGYELQLVTLMRCLTSLLQFTISGAVS